MQLDLFVRPLGDLLIPVFLALDTMVAAVRDVREDGCHRQRRFRRDTPILPRFVRPRPRAATGSVR